MGNGSSVTTGQVRDVVAIREGDRSPLLGGVRGAAMSSQGLGFESLAAQPLYTIIGISSARAAAASIGSGSAVGSSMVSGVQLIGGSHPAAAARFHVRLNVARRSAQRPRAARADGGLALKAA